MEMDSVHSSVYTSVLGSLDNFGRVPAKIWLCVCSSFRSLILKIETFLYFLGCMGQVIFFFMYFFTLDLETAISIASVTAMLTTLCYRYSRSFRNAMVLSLVDYLGYYSQVICVFLLTSTVVHGPYVRIYSHYNQYTDSLQCGQKILKFELHRAYQAGLKHTEEAVIKAFQQWNSTAHEGKILMGAISDSMDAVATEVEHISGVFDKTRESCRDQLPASLSSCETQSRDAKKNCKDSIWPFHVLCEVVEIAPAACNLLGKVDLCSIFEVTRPLKDIEGSIRTESDKVRDAMTLNLKSSAKGSLNISMPGIDGIYADALFYVRAAMSSSQMLWRACGLCFACVFVLKPLQNYQLLRRLSDFDDVVTHSSMLSMWKIMSLVLYLCAIIFLYVIDTVLPFFLCRDDTAEPTVIIINGSVFTHIEVNGGIIAKEVAKLLISSVEEASNYTSHAQLSECIPSCRLAIAWAEIVQLLLLFSLLTFLRSHEKTVCDYKHRVAKVLQRA